MVELSDWQGLVDSRADSFDALTVALTVAPGPATWSGPFRVTASDGDDYFVKALDTCPTGEGASLAVERIVAEVGRLIGAPMCSTNLIRITSDIAGWSPRPGVVLTEGLAHASLALERADELGRPYLAARSQDDNARRHVGIYAIFDWCFGSDQQWLYDIDNDRTIYSHDHGLYLRPTGTPVWTPADLEAVIDDPHPLPDAATGLNSQEIETIANGLESVDRDTLRAILNSVPASWPVSDEALEAAGWFLERRAKPVASRIRNLI